MMAVKIKIQQRGGGGGGVIPMSVDIIMSHFFYAKGNSLGCTI